MTTVQRTVTVYRPPRVVFDAAGDVLGYPGLLPAVVSTRILTGEPPEAGAVYEMVVRVWGVRVVWRCRVVEADPPHQQVHECRWRYGVVLRELVLEPLETTRTRAELSVTLRTLPHVPVVGQVVDEVVFQRYLRSHVPKTAENLKRAAEAIDQTRSH